MVLISYSDVFAEDTHLQGDIPIATQWMIDAAGPTGRAAINSVFLIYGKKSQTKGTGFLIEDKQIITNNHVIEGNELEDIIVFSSRREEIPVIAINRDSDRDLAALKIDRQLHGWLELAPSSNIPIGLSVTTWGYPLGYNGPAPILAVGFLAGFNDRKVDNGVVRHLIVNGAFNPGNSGGPLLDQSGKVIGVVVSKHAPIPKLLLSAIKVMQGVDFGVKYTIKDNDIGEESSISESQPLAEWLLYFTQK